MLEILGEEVSQAFAVDHAPHLLLGLLGDCDCRRSVAVRGGSDRKHGEHVTPAVGAGLDDEAMLALGDLGEGEVEARPGPRPGTHGRTEAGATGYAAVDHDHEGPGPAQRVVALDILALEEDAILDCDRVEIARTGTQERQRPLGSWILDEHRHAVVARRGLPQADSGWEELLLPRMRADRPPEDGRVVAPPQPRARGFVIGRPPVREVVGRGDLVEHDRRVTHGRSDDPVALGLQGRDERREPVEGQHVGVGVGGGEFGHGWRQPTIRARQRKGTRSRIRRFAFATRKRNAAPVTLPVVIERRRIRVRGVVQGVGFRPFVHRLATRDRLGGRVWNDGDGVVVEVEGPRPVLDAFALALVEEAPPLARVVSVTGEPLEPLGEHGFEVAASHRSGGSALVPADVATCADCLRELFDPRDRRYRYPFTNCTNCGPRLTIVTAVPYDRARTTMAGFTLCTDCRREYEDPTDRRFHAEPIACPECGPRLSLPLDDAARALRDGAIVAVKGLGGYHLACDATNEPAVARLRERKRRDEKPFAVMGTDPQLLGEPTDREMELLASPAHPIVLVRRRAGAPLADSVAPGTPWIGLMLPYTPLHHLLCADVGVPLVMTSGNLSDEPIAYEDDEARRRLGEVADLFLAHDRPIRRRCEDSVVSAGFPLRRSRGYAPSALALPVPAPEPLIAVGAAFKSTFCVARGGEALLSAHLGDLSSEESSRAFRHDLDLWLDMLGVKPMAVACDLHPDYLSTRWAWEQAVPVIEVQHHHAHAAACLAEHGETGPALAIVLDGTGFGTDGTIWGGEVLRCDLTTFERVAHLEPIPLPGGDAAVREPWRIAAAYLERAARPVPWERWDLVRQSLSVNAPLSSAAGRLFDAVSALLGVREQITYEGQAAIELEHLAGDVPAPAYDCTLEHGVIRGADLVAAAADDLRSGRDRAEIAAAFHEGVAATFTAACVEVAEPRTVVLSGGCLQNRRLLASLRTRLEQAGFRVLSHAAVPPNDGGVSYGQAAVAAARLACA